MLVINLFGAPGSSKNKVAKLLKKKLSKRTDLKCSVITTKSKTDVNDQLISITNKYKSLKVKSEKCDIVIMTSPIFSEAVYNENVNCNRKVLSDSNVYNLVSELHDGFDSINFLLPVVDSLSVYEDYDLEDILSIQSRLENLLNHAEIEYFKLLSDEYSGDEEGISKKATEYTNFIVGKVLGKDTGDFKVFDGHLLGEHIKLVSKS